MKKFRWLAVWILLGALLTWATTYAVGSALVAFALSYSVIRLWRRRRSVNTTKSY